MKMTIYDVAREAGVSIATVSRVINNKGKVKKATQGKVEAAIKKLGFLPQPSPSTFSTPLSTKSIGILVPDLVNEYWSLFARVVQEEMWRLGYSVLICSPIDLDQTLNQEITFLKNLVERKVEGVIYCSSINHDGGEVPVHTYLQEYPIPVVAIDQNISGISKVSGDHVNGSAKATEHLISLGHTEIAYIGGPLHYPDRELGFRSAHLTNGMVVNESIIRRGYPTYQFGYHAMRDLLKDRLPFTAIACGNDLIALGVMKAIDEANLIVPDDLAVIGYDDILMASLVKPGLTTVRQPIREMGTTAVSMLIHLIEKNGGNEQPKNIVFPMDLMIRSSCGVST